MTNLFNDEDLIDIDPNKNYLEEYVGEGKKFKDVEALARAKAESDTFIERLKKEQSELRNDYLRLREEYNAVPKLQELVEKLTEQQLASSDDNTLNAKEDIKTAISSEEIESLVSKKVQEMEMTKKQEENYRSVQAKLIERYGDKYQNVLKQLMESMNLSESFVNSMAREQPNVFLKLFLSDSVTSVSSLHEPPKSSARSDSFSPTSHQKRTWSHYENMRKASPEVYWSPKIQNQMHQDAQKFGDEFYNS